jgi:hypothetical protein
MTVALFEGAIIVAALLAFADLLDWWSVLAIPAIIAVLVKFNDLVAGLPVKALLRPPDRARGVARVQSRSDPASKP